MNKEISEAAAALGRKGAKAVMKKYGKDHYIMMGKRSGEERRKRMEEEKKLEEVKLEK